MPYEDYKEFLGRRYEAGRNDCYGLVKDYYAKVFDLHMKDYARPEGFSEFGLNLIEDNFVQEGFQIVDVPHARLVRGDGILFRVNRSLRANHVGVFLGNNTFLHHLWNGVSREETWDTRWKGRCISIVRHPEVYELATKPEDVVNILSLIPPHLLQRNEGPTS